MPTSVKTGRSISWVCSAKQAEKHGLYMMPTAGVFGFAVIAEDKDGWVVDHAYSILPPNVSVTQDLNGFNVTLSPKLQMVQTTTAT